MTLTGKQFDFDHLTSFRPIEIALFGKIIISHDTIVLAWFKRYLTVFSNQATGKQLDTSATPTPPTADSQTTAIQTHPDPPGDQACGNDEPQSLTIPSLEAHVDKLCGILQPTLVELGEGARTIRAFVELKNPPIVEGGWGISVQDSAIELLIEAEVINSFQI
jgi:hypothetical protein